MLKVYFTCCMCLLISRFLFLLWKIFENDLTTYRLVYIQFNTGRHIKYVYIFKYAIYLNILYVA